MELQIEWTECLVRMNARRGRVYMVRWLVHKKKTKDKNTNLCPFFLKLTYIILDLFLFFVHWIVLPSSINSFSYFISQIDSSCFGNYLLRSFSFFLRFFPCHSQFASSLNGYIKIFFFIFTHFRWKWDSTIFQTVTHYPLNIRLYGGGTMEMESWPRPKSP